MTMAHSVEDIALTEIDLLQIDSASFADVESSPETVRFAIILTSAPSEGWITVFHTLYDRARLTINPPVEVVEDRLWIDFLPRYEKELQTYLNQLRGLAKLTNDDMRHTSEISAGLHADAKKQEFRQRLLAVKI
jgi:hypothetical protein